MIISDALTWNLISNPDVNSSVQVWKMRVGHLNLTAAARIAGRPVGWLDGCGVEGVFFVIFRSMRQNDL